MKLALIGYGVMGQLVVVAAKKAGDEIGYIVKPDDAGLSVDQLADRLRGHEVAIDFSAGEAVPRNIEACVRAGVPIVEGTTGWKAHENEIKQLVNEQGGALVYGANFSI